MGSSGERISDWLVLMIKFSGHVCAHTLVWILGEVSLDSLRVKGEGLTLVPTSHWPVICQGVM